MEAHPLALNHGLSNKEYTKAVLLGSFMTFAKVIYELKTGREFFISTPAGREPHVITIAKELKAVFNGDTTRLLINVPPGHHKSTLLVLWVAWCMANYPDCNFLYISHAYELAEKHTATIKEIMEMPFYRETFGVELRTDSKAKGRFKTTVGGCVAAFGSQGAVVGQDAGLPNCDRFSGAVIIDDAHKPDDCHSETLRQKVIDNYNETIKQRPRSSRVPIIFIGQRLHEQDLPAFFIAGSDGYDWKKVILKSLDSAGNALYPEVFPKEMLLIEQRVNAYAFWSQHMQTPQPDGGGVFQKEWFQQFEIEPEIISSFITIDSAETDKNWNDATAMSFFGVYRMVFRGIDFGMYGLHWLAAREVRIEPKDLESEFYDFYAECMRHRVKPERVLIEKKSTGTTLSSILKGVPGLRVMDIERNAGQGNKTKRFFECQKYVAGNRISLTKGARHVEMCLEHMRKITSNMSHAHDDIGDSLEMAIRAALIEETLLPREDHNKSNIIATLNRKSNTLAHLRRQL